MPPAPQPGDPKAASHHRDPESRHAHPTRHRPITASSHPPLHAVALETPSSRQASSAVCGWTAAAETAAAARASTRTAREGAKGGPTKRCSAGAWDRGAHLLGRQRRAVDRPAGAAGTACRQCGWDDGEGEQLGRDDRHGEGDNVAAFEQEEQGPPGSSQGKR